MFRLEPIGLNLLFIVSAALWSSCATDDAAQTQRLHAEARRLQELTSDRDLSLRMEQQAMHLYPDIVAQLDRLHAEHRVITAPRMTHAKTPIYPFSRRLHDMQGVVWVAFVLGPDGVPTRIAALSIDGALNDPAFVDAAVSAVSQWRFTPAHVDNESIPVIQCVPVVFQLR